MEGWVRVEVQAGNSVEVGFRWCLNARVYIGADRRHLGYLGYCLMYLRQDGIALEVDL